VKFALACYGSRGDVEPSAAVGRELLRRGHEVRMAVPPEQVGFVEATGLAAVDFGLDAEAPMEAQQDFMGCLMRTPWRIRDLIRLWREHENVLSECWTAMTTTLTSLADGTDLILSGLVFQQVAANVAEYHDIPLATLHWFPMRVNGQLMPSLPAPLTRAAMRLDDRLGWRMTRTAENAQRRALSLPKATGPSSQRIGRRGSLELQGYDEIFFPGLAAEWAEWDGHRPFVGALTLELPTDADDEVASWVAAGTPPVYFGFGSPTIDSPADTLAMISAACRQLGERALVCAGWSDCTGLADSEHVKVVNSVNFAATFPACRAIVHHGGAGTTAASLRSGVPTLILWTDFAQPIWGVQIKRLGVGTARQFSRSTSESLVSDLRTILAPQYITRAREVGCQAITAAESARVAADLVENFARRRRTD